MRNEIDLGLIQNFPIRLMFQEIQRPTVFFVYEWLTTHASLPTGHTRKPQTVFYWA